MGFTASLLVTEAPDDRQSQRRAVDSLSTLRAHSFATDVFVTDLSRTGCAIVTEAEMALGTEISIGLVGFGAFDAKIVRRSGETYGCEFVEPIAAEIVANAFTASTVVSGPASFDSDITAPPSPGFPEPVVGKWTPAVRMMFVIGTSAALWYALAELAFNASA